MKPESSQKTLSSHVLLALGENPLDDVLHGHHTLKLTWVIDQCQLNTCLLHALKHCVKWRLG